VILDATFSKRSHRRQVCQLARAYDATLIFAECRAPLTILKQRLQSREIQPGLSDARLQNLHEFIETQEPFSDLAPPVYLPLDTTQPIASLLQTISATTHRLTTRQIELKMK
jgi:predicted kinase